MKPVFALAPLANITTMPFRSICKELGADLVYSPMISSNAIIHNPEKTLNIARFLPQEQPVIIQLFGYSGQLIGQAAKIVESELKPAGIDINMGCPAPKITGNECGSALLKDLDKVMNLVKEVRGIYNGPLSIKLRLGWSEFNVLGFIKGLEKYQINMIAVHGRTAAQGYKGVNDWEAINQIAQSTNIPVLGNGDIKTWQEAYQRLDGSNLAGIMIGRAALGNPWIFKEIKEQKTIEIDNRELIRVIRLQTKRYLTFCPEAIAIREMRKHLCWYLKGFANAKELRDRAVHVSSREDIENLLNSLESKAKLS